MVITLYYFNIYYIEENNIRALYKACFFKLFLAATKEPVLFSVLLAEAIALIHFFPVLFLFVLLFFLENFKLYRLVDIYI